MQLRCQRLVRSLAIPSLATAWVIHSQIAPKMHCKRELTTMKVKAEDILRKPNFPEKPFYRPDDFRRQDESSDTSFYGQPRLVYHIDEPAVKALSSYYAEVFPANAEVLDLCSSWVSHFPPGAKIKGAVGLGMNEFELKKNKQLSSYVVKDLNKDARLPFDDLSFDVVTCVVSVDYLTKPLDVLKESARVLRPGGRAIFSFSNRCFPTKAISLWLETGDEGHVLIVGSYFHYSSPDWEAPEAKDISPYPGRSDPMYIVTARKTDKASS